MVYDLIKAFFAIFIVMDSLGNLPIFLSFIKNTPKKNREHMVKETILVAGVILLLFLFFGMVILEFFNIDIHSFKIAGGLILLIFGLKLVLGLKLLEERAEKYKSAVVPLATPLITGPGVITTIIILVNQFGTMAVLIASLLNLFVTYLFLDNVEYLYKILGRQGSDALSKIMGLILTAIAIGFIKQGWIGV